RGRRRAGADCPSPAPDRAPPAPVALEATAETISAGQTAYQRWCAACHGEAAVGGGVVPDLRYSDPAVYDSFDDIVLEGSRSQLGMPSFASFLDAEAVAAIRAYVISLRNELSGP